MAPPVHLPNRGHITRVFANPRRQPSQPRNFVWVESVVPFPREFIPPTPNPGHAFYPFFPQRRLKPWWAAASGRRPWIDWPQDEARRNDRRPDWRVYYPQNPLSPVFAAASARKPWSDWSEDQARRNENVAGRFFFPQTKLDAITAAGSERRRWEYWPETEVRREFIFFFPTTAVVTTPFFVDQPVPRFWDYWPKDEAQRPDYGRFFMPQNALKPTWANASERKPWSDWPGDEAKRERVDLYRVYAPQNPLSPVWAAASERRRWEYWPETEVRREFIFLSPPVTATVPYFVGQPYRAPWTDWPADAAVRSEMGFYPQMSLQAWYVQPDAHAQGPVEFRRVSDDGWSAFRPFWTPPSTTPPYFVGQPYRAPWNYWPTDEARRDDLSRYFMPQTKLTPQVGFQAETRQQQGGIEFRRIDDPWGDFRPFWTPPSTAPSFIIGMPPPTPWPYWPKDEAQRPDYSRYFMPQTGLDAITGYGSARRPWSEWTVDEARRNERIGDRLFMPQTGLVPWVATQAENRQQQGPVEFRRVSDNGWDLWIFFVIPPTPPTILAGNVPLWAVGPKGIKTKIAFYSKQEPETED